MQYGMSSNFCLALFFHNVHSQCTLPQRRSSQVTFISIALYVIQIVSKQLYSVKQENIDSVMQTKFNSGLISSA